MFGWEFPPFNSGGLGVACEGMARALSIKGVDLSFVLPYKLPIKKNWCSIIFADETTSFKNMDDIVNMTSGYERGLKKDHLYHPVSKSTPKQNSIMGRVFKYARSAPSIAKGIEHSIIHSHDWLTYPAGIMAKSVSKKPLVAHIHATEFDRCGGENINKDIFEIEKEGFSKADMVVAVSGKTRKTVLEKYKIDPDKVRVVHNGVDFVDEKVDIHHDLEILKKYGASVVLFVGRITLQKGPDYFVALAQQVLKFEPKTFFVVSGSGDMEGSMISEVSRRGLTDHFIFCGFLRGLELRRVFKVADVFVMPSVSEPFGIVPLEAMLSDIPVLISKESGVSEVVSEVLKSHFWDVDDMTDKVVNILRHKKLKEHLSINGKREAQNINWGKAADSLLSIYNDLILTSS
ncbi:MAG: glycosyltransferase family 4 protein [Patescibacteria group bacterium]